MDENDNYSNNQLGNISKTEYKAYLECPMKFYIIKSLNQHKPLGPRGRRDYSGFSMQEKEGMFWHYWLMDFHENYQWEVKKEKPAPTGEDPYQTFVMTAFYDLELKRYQENQRFWYPITECYVQSQLYRGTIDRIDQLNEQGDCRIVEYKKKEGAYDWKEVMFYGNLVTKEIANIENLPKNAQVKELAIYYYSTGKLVMKELKKEDLEVFEQELEELRKEMSKPNWVRKKGCDGNSQKCRYSGICKTIALKNNSKRNKQ